MVYNLKIDPAVSGAAEAKHLVSHFLNEMRRNGATIRPFTLSALADKCRSFNRAEIDIEQFKSFMHKQFDTFVHIEDVTKTINQGEVKRWMQNHRKRLPATV